MSQCIGLIGSRQFNGEKDYIVLKRAVKKLYSSGDRFATGSMIHCGVDRLAMVLAKSLGAPITVFHKPTKTKKEDAIDLRILEIVDVLVVMSSKTSKHTTLLVDAATKGGKNVVIVQAPGV